MSRTVHTKGQNNWQPCHRTQWQREKRDGRLRPTTARRWWQFWKAER